MKIPIALLALAASACAHQPAMDAAASLAAAEAAFAAHSVRVDMRAAFLANFADDGVFVRPGGWKVSNEFLRDRPAPPIVLDWRPQFVEVARSGEMGLSTGPWKLTGKADPAAAPAYGQFVSLWRRDASGTWKVAVDLGIAHATPSLWDAPLVTRAVPSVDGAAVAGIVDAEARFMADAAQRGARAAYAADGAEDLRYYRDGNEPVAGRAIALSSPAMDDAALLWIVERSETARSGDFGYARGRYASPAEPGKALGWFLRVWRREAGGWRIVMDVANPAPKS